MTSHAVAVQPSSALMRALRTEAQAALATPVARLLLAGSVVMAMISCTANLAVLDSLAGEDPVRIALHAATVPALVFSMIAGAYATSSERRNGFIDQRLLCDPSRVRWLRSKALAQTVIGLVYGILGVASAVVTSTIVFALRDTTFDATSAVTIRSLLGVMIATPLFALIGTAIGSLTPNTSGVLAALLVWVLVIEPPAVLGLPELGRLMPAASGLALTYSPDDALLGQPLGGAVLALYAAAGLAYATRRIRTADV